MQALALLGQLGFSIAIPPAVLAFLGNWADQRFGTGPWLLLVGIVLGALLAFYTLYRMLKDATS